MTGWPQVNGSRGEPETLEKMQKRVELDLWYINNWSIWLDFSIMVSTIFVVFVCALNMRSTRKGPLRSIGFARRRLAAAWETPFSLIEAGAGRGRT
jgi:hypothetical protein